MHRSYLSQQIMYGSFIDKLLIWLLCAIFCFRLQPTPFTISYILVSLAISCFYSLWNRPLARHILVTIYYSFCLFDSVFLLFLPLIVYDMFHDYPLWLLAFIVLISLSFFPTGVYRFDFVAFTILAIILKIKSALLTDIQQESRILRDNHKELMMKLEQKNVELLEKQDYEINLATLNERNRISREIHDNVGHQLTRAILQVGAMQYLPIDEQLKQKLQQVKDSLDESMNSIRTSVHQLYDDSIDLRFEIEKMVHAFTFCPINYQYQVHSTLSQKEKLALLAIIKEALTNITKHSNAQKCSIRVKEHPGFIQLKICDDGKNVLTNVNGGIGLQSITERVQQLSGYCEFNTEKGFQIFITIPKEGNS